MTIQLSRYVVTQQAEVIAALLRKDGALRLYSGAQPNIETRTEGRLVSCTISAVTIEGGTLTIKWDKAEVIKEGVAGFFRLVSGNIPVLSGSIPAQMQMDDVNLKVNTIIDAGEMTHTVFKAE